MLILFLALMMNFIQVIRGLPGIFLGKVASPSDYSDRLSARLFEAIEKNDIDQIKRSIALGANINDPVSQQDDVLQLLPETPLFHAIRYRNHDAVSALLEAGADVNGRGSHSSTPLMYALSHPACQSLKR